MHRSSIAMTICCPRISSTRQKKTHISVLASNRLEDIIEDIKSCGFTKGAKYFEPNWYTIAIRNLRLGINNRAYIRKSFKLLQELNTFKSFNENTRTEIYALREKHGLLHLETCTREALIATYKDFAPYFDVKFKKRLGRLRFVDFNQGVDARLFSRRIVKLLAEIPVRPLRIAFDNIRTELEYTKALTMSEEYGMKDFSNYLLYNFTDKPEELYHSCSLCLKHSCCSDFSLSIWDIHRNGAKPCWN